MYVCAHVCRCMQRPEFTRSSFLNLWLVTLVFETSPLSDPGAHWLDWPWKPRDPPAPALPCPIEVLELPAYAAMPSL